MIHWLDEPIIHSVLIGLIMIGWFGILWASYVRIWQLFIWNTCGDAISTAMDRGYQISMYRFSPSIGIQQGGHTVIWKGGLFGERMEGPNGVSQWVITHEEISQILS